MFFFEKSEIVKRLKKYPVLECFSEKELEKLVEQSEVMTLPAEQILFTCDEPSDSVYYLMDGYLECFSSDSFAKKVASIRSGEMVGEMGVVAQEPRSMVVKSTRDSQLLKIDQAVFLKFFQKDPELLLLLAQTMAKRLRQMILGLQETHYAYKNIGIVVMSPVVPVEDMKAVFHQNAPLDRACFYDKKAFELEKTDLVPFFYECEENLGVNVFFAESNGDDWSQGILDHVDYLYLVIDESMVTKIDSEVLSKIRQRPCDMVIFHAALGPYKNTEKVYRAHPFKRHHHIIDRKGDYQRLYRYVTGQAIGLVISGGGFRGFAHHGLVKALFEAGIPIDCIAGSSMGAATGALLALNFNWKSFDNVFKESMKRLKKIRLWRHFTLPMMSILSGEGATHLMKKLFGSHQIEDLMINYFCVVTNLSKTRKEIKKRGDLWKWIRASAAIPGLLPPLENNGDVYVDGAVSTNLPVFDMREYLDGAGKIITFDIRVPAFTHNAYKFPPIWAFKDALAHGLGFSKSKHYVLPKFIDIVMESSIVNQTIYDMQGAKKADIIVAPDTSALSFYNARKNDALSMLSYELAHEKLQEAKAVYERWII